MGSRDVRQFRSPPQPLEVGRRPADFDDFIENLRSELRQGRFALKKGSSPFDNWSGRVRRSVYAWVRHLKRTGQLKIIKTTLDRSYFTTKKVSFRENPFYWALYAAQKEGEIDLTDKDVSRFALQMLYADRHNIEPELLVGFIYQQGNEKMLVEKVKSGAVEAWFSAQTARSADGW